MGKKGQALRAAKAQKTISFTWQELEEHDAKVRREFLSLGEKQLDKINIQKQKEIMEELDADWERKAKIFCTGDKREDTEAIFRNLMFLSAQILIEDFGWVVPKRQLKTSKILRFVSAMNERINDISRDDSKDLLLCNEIFTDKYGIEFLTVEE